MRLKRGQFFKLAVTAVMVLLVSASAIGCGSASDEATAETKVKASNAVALLYDAIGEILSYKSFDFTFEYFNEYGYPDVRWSDLSLGSGFIKYGTDIDTSTLYIRTSNDGDTYEVALNNGNMYTASWGDVEYISVIDLLDYYSDEADSDYAYGYIEDFRYDIMKRIISADYINSFFKDGHLDQEGIVTAFLLEFGNYLTAGFLEYEDADYTMIDMGVREELLELVESFIYNGLNDAITMSRAISDYETTSIGNSTMHTFTLNLQGSIRELFRYIIDNYTNYEELSSAFEELIKDAHFVDSFTSSFGVAPRSVPSALIIFRDNILGELTSSISYGDIANPVFSITVDSESTLQRIELSTVTHMEKYRMFLELDNHNNASIDEALLKHLADNATMLEMY